MLTAVITALGAALLFGISSVADQRSTKRVPTRQALSPRILLDLVWQPLWLTAIFANVVGFALQVIALRMGSLALVQPLLVCNLIFAVLIVWFLDRRRATETRAGQRVIFWSVAATAAGLAGFLAIGRPSAGHTRVSVAVLPPLAAAIVLVVGGCLVLAARSASLRPLALALACGFCYGVAAFAIKGVTADFGGGPGQVFTSWPVYFLAVVGPAGFVLNQDAFQQGTHLAPVQAVITVSDPVISVVLGVGALGVTLRGGTAAVTGEVISLLLMTAGIVMVAHQAHPAPAAPPC